MKNFDVLVIGGSAAGLTAALTARRHYPDKSIALVRKEEKVVVPCGIPYVFGTVDSPEKNVIPDDTYKANNIDLIISKVDGLDKEKKTIKLSDGEEIQYDKLIIATGSTGFAPPIPGIDKKNVFIVQKDLDYIKQMLEAMTDAKNIVIVGCGFIGVEFAEECRKGKPDAKISVIEMLHNCLQLVFDDDFCNRCEESLSAGNIDLQLEERLQSIEGGEQVDSIKLASGKTIEADMVIVGIGAKTNIDLAKQAELVIGPTGGIGVNRYMQTSNTDIFSCGDCAEKVSFFDGQPSNLKLASIATMEARIAGANLFEPRRTNMGVIGIFSTVVGESSFAAAGLTETNAREKGYHILVGEAEAPNRHPGCMPGAEMLKVKLIFEKGSRILIGGQVSGAKSGGEMINAISAYLHHRTTADDIATFQMGTHPALNASPVVYQLVNAAENALAGLYKQK
jgi:NADPH-dependent 2,4-dienoyl-CoA reductase/sulfur reductase-like enzyme